MFGNKFVLKAYAYDFLILEGFVSFFVTVLTFLVEGGIVDVAIKGVTTIEGREEVDTNRTVFSFGFTVEEINNLSLLLYRAQPMIFKIHLLMVNFFSLSKMSWSYFEAKIELISSQRLLTTSIKSSLSFSLLNR